MNYILAALAEAHLARVPNQLIEPDQNVDNGNEDEVEEVNEFSGMGGGSVMGYSGPLGGKTKKKTRK